MRIQAKSMEGLGMVFALGLLFLSSGAAATPAALPSALPSPTAESLTQAESQSLLREFNRALHAESRALEHRQKFEWKELVASQKARKREWLEREGKERREFFTKNTKGAERRTYIQDLQMRRRNMEKMMSDEKRDRLQEQRVRKKSLVHDQVSRRKEFLEYLNRSERPPERLWPRPGT